MFQMDRDSPTEKMLHNWGDKNNYLDDLVKKLLEMQRLDVAELLQKEIDKMGDGCNCPNCGSLR